MTTTQAGVRKDITEDHLMFEAGEYGKYGDHWMGRPPNTIWSFVANLDAHEVTEHEDGTITVSPSILIKHYDGSTWHGYLERGIWREI